jgi:hypothetical protein
MRVRSMIGSVVLLAVAVAPTIAWAQLPSGIPSPGGMSLPTTGFSKDALLSQAKEALADLTSMKSSGKLAPEQVQKVDTLLPKAQSLNTELAKPQVDAASLPQMASNLSELQKEVGVLKGFMK